MKIHCTYGSNRSFVSRSPHHYDPPPEIIVNSNMYMYPHHGKRDYYEQFPRTHYQMQEPCATATVEGNKKKHAVFSWSTFYIN